MSTFTDRDPAEQQPFMRLFYRNWRPTRFGHYANTFWCLWAGMGLPPRILGALEVRGRASGRKYSTVLVIATVPGKRYLVSMLGPRSEWVQTSRRHTGRQ